MGLLDSILGGIDRAQNSQHFQYLLNRDRGMSAADSRYAVMEALAEEEERKKRDELFKLQLEAARRAQEEAAKAKQREEVSRAVLQSASAQGMGGFQSPEAQSLLRPWAAAQADPAMLEQGGLLAPMKQPMSPESLLGHFTPESVYAYTQNGDIRGLQRLPQQVPPQQPLGDRDLAGKFTPESIAKFKATGNVADLVLLPPATTPAQQQSELQLRERFGALNEIGGRMAKLIGSPDFAGAVGPVDKYTARAGSWFGTEEGLANRAASRIGKEMILELAQAVKPISNSDIAFLEESLPTTGDSPAVWQDWYINTFIPKANSASMAAYGVPIFDAAGPSAQGGANSAVNAARDYLKNRNKRFTQHGR
jgi:hypothetical protein